MLPSLSKTLLNQWNTLLPHFPRPDSIDYLGIAGSVEGGTTTFLGFGRGQKKPIFVIKVHREPDARPRIESERRILEKLRSSPLSESVPRVYFSGNVGGAWVIVESILEGAPMTVHLSDRGTPSAETARQDMVQVESWLRTLAEATFQSDPLSCGELATRGHETIRAFESLFPLTEEERSLVHQIGESLDQIASQGGYLQHGDFCRQNILVSQNGGGNRLSVIDWTDGCSLGLPLHDLFFFVTSYYLQARHGSGKDSFLQAFHETFFDSAPYAQTVRKVILGHPLAQNFDSGERSALFGIFLMNQALFEYKKMSHCGAQGGLPRFLLHLALVNQKTLQEALKEQVWIYFFRHFVKNRITFLAGS